MTITIDELEPSDDSHCHYHVDFDSDCIEAVVTHDPHVVSTWIDVTERIHSRRLSHLIVGLDVEWRPNYGRYRNPVAIIQICVGRRCLIFQVLHCTSTFGYDIPDELRRFLNDEDYTFVGVGIGADVQKLEEDYGIEVGGRVVDLRGLAAKDYGMNWLRNAGLKDLARVVLDREVEKPRWITMSRWDYRWLTLDQIKYASVDAFVSFEIGRCLNACYDQ